MTYKVESGTEIPKKNSGSKPKYPFRKCINVKDNFFVPDVTSEYMASLCVWWKKKIGWTFTVRSETILIDGLKTHGVRVWREE